MTKKNASALNGGVDLLAGAMRQVFQECMDGLAGKIDAVSGKTDCLANRLNKQPCSLT